ncbi:Peptidase M20 domain-containing protein 2 [Geodia barretti]|uniref:Peptidase M20 domain-containing protein 2 n=1 Tax=Geodia barretti TaxID=519541 RepID=A0AA35RHT7_GEOBA|nr:Peptidase M20 domain-containing protein 2 [Geodia barretti]
MLCRFLEQQNFQVERGIGGVETAFRATIPGGSGDGPTIAVLAEYDALPEIGHGCGHNLIAMAAMGAALGLQANAQDLQGCVVIIGTPAEEGGGGKIKLTGGGVFRRRGPTLFAAHAAAAPEAGINALNAVIHLFTGIDAMRQHLRDDVRIHGIITDGGMAPNVVPGFAPPPFSLHARAASIVIGPYRERPVVVDKNVQPNVALARALGANAEALGIKLDEPVAGRPGSGASTDFGNVSQVMPAFELRYAVSERAGASDTGTAVGLTAGDLLRDNSLVEAAKAEFADRTG